MPNGIVTAKPCSKNLTTEICGVKIHLKLFFLIGAHITLALVCETEINSYVTYVTVLSNINYNIHVQILERSDKLIKNLE